MVATRRSDGNAAPTSTVSPRPIKRRKTTASSVSVNNRKPVTVQSSNLRASFLASNSTAPSKPNGELPSSGRPPGKGSTTKVDQALHEPLRTSTKQIMASLQKLSTPGSSDNPIVLIEDSPRAKVSRKNIEHSKAEPHRFQDRHSKLYTYKAARPVLAPKPANGSTFTGHPGHDIYRVHMAKMVQLSRYQHDHHRLPFEMQCPMSAQYLVSQHGATNPHIRSAIHHYTPPLSSYPRHMAPPPSEEEQLRRKAAQYVREYARPWPPKRMAEDPDETSESDSEKVDQDTTLSRRKSRLKQIASSSGKLESSPVAIMSDHHLQLTPLMEHASLLALLLQVYPQSADQKGLREDIATLASVQNQHLANWLNLETVQPRKMANPHIPRMSRSTTASPAKLVVHDRTDGEIAETDKKKKQDDGIRGLLSADAELWQDGSGLGVADVYAETRASTPPTVQSANINVQGKTAVVSASPPRRHTISGQILSRKQGENLSVPVVNAHPAVRVT